MNKTYQIVELIKKEDIEQTINHLNKYVGLLNMIPFGEHRAGSVVFFGYSITRHDDNTGKLLLYFEIRKKLIDKFYRIDMIKYVYSDFNLLFDPIKLQEINA